MDQQDEHLESKGTDLQVLKVPINIFSIFAG